MPQNSKVFKLLTVHPDIKRELVVGVFKEKILLKEFNTKILPQIAKQS
jgi:hypothetical protein